VSSQQLQAATPATFPHAWWANGLTRHEREAGVAPVWAAHTEQVVATPSPADVVPAEWRAAFASAFAPFIAEACGVIDNADALHEGVDVVGVRTCLADQLAARLTALTARTLVLELNKARAAGSLHGDTPSDRFADFVRQLGTPAGLTTLFTTYPVLARLVSQACRFATESYVELLQRFATDRQMLVGTVADAELGTLVRVRGGAGDAHQRGRSVKALEFSGGQRVIYKPRPLTLHTRFAEMVWWLNNRVPGLEIEAVPALVRPGYGWLRFVEHRPCADLTEVDLFYRRQGVLLALLYAVDGADVHFENLIACGGQPVLIDIETLFHPALPGGGEAVDPATGALSRSVLRTCLLPQLFIGEHGALDISGMGGGKGGTFPTDRVDWLDAGTDLMRLIRSPGGSPDGHNRPTLGDRDIEPGEHGAALLAGFRIGYDAIVSGIGELSALLGECAEDVIRVLVRPTNFYARLLDETTHPELLRDAEDRDRAFGLLWDDSAGDAARERLVAGELEDLWHGDIPMFTGKPGSPHLWDSAGRRVDDLLTEPPLDVVTAKLASMNAVDRRDQEWLISASLATRPAAISHSATETIAETLLSAAPDTGRLLAAACGVADQIVARAFSDDQRANWLGLELVDELYWTVLPMGASLGEGYTGVALFLAQLADLTGIGHYRDLATQALRPVSALLDRLEAEPELAEAAGGGGLLGLGGVAYGLARLSSLLNEPALAGLAERTVSIMPVAGPGTPRQFTTGLAGGIAAMRGVHVQLGLDSAVRVAAGYTAHLAVPDLTGEPAGFAHGTAGIHWASRASLPTGPVTAPAGHGWCSGLAGTVLAYAETPSALDGLGGLDHCVETLAAQAPLRDMSLCHGEFGIVDVLSVLAAGGHGGAQAAANRRTGRLLSVIEQQGARCGTPGAVSSPGLLTGLAGIGYGLLRLGFGDRVPSVLTLGAGTRADH
jgi:type 2 lantibiotic biosynthesis protein LanM